MEKIKQKSKMASDEFDELDVTVIVVLCLLNGHSNRRPTRHRWRWCTWCQFSRKQQFLTISRVSSMVVVNNCENVVMWWDILMKSEFHPIYMREQFLPKLSVNIGKAMPIRLLHELIIRRQWLGFCETAVRLCKLLETWRDMFARIWNSSVWQHVCCRAQSTQNWDLTNSWITIVSGFFREN